MKRRDFLQGTALALTAGTGAAPLEALARERPEGAYPPALTGLRGAHPGSFEVAHDLAWNGKTWPRPKAQTDSIYDLIIVGGGLSGLAAAYFYRQRIGADARILILDNHDDFGGHAKRNEFTVRGKTLLGYGGSQSLSSPRGYSLVAKRLLEELGFRAGPFRRYFDFEFDRRHGLTEGALFRSADNGRSGLAADAFSPFGGPSQAEKARRIAEFPVSEATRRGLTALSAGAMRDTPAVREMLAAPNKTPAEAFLRTAYGFTDEGIQFMRRRSGPLWGAGLDVLSVTEGVIEGWLGEAAAEATYPYLEDELEARDEQQPYVFHFPDGNASVARLLVRSLIPGSIAGASMNDVVMARAEYTRLDDPNHRVRIRLGSTAVRAENRAGGVDLTYVSGGEVHRSRALHSVLACYNNMIPHLCPDVGKVQREALAYPEKVPLGIINVALDNWQAIQRSGISQFYAPSGLLTIAGMDFPVSMGGYAFTAEPSEPCVLQCWQTPACGQSGDPFEQFRAGRMAMYQMPFAEYEAGIFDQLDAAWGPHGLDVERDIAAITVNRWPHGYSHEYLNLWDDPAWGRGAGPHVIGRQQVGQIAIANADSEAYAYVDGAFNAAYRAVRELTNDG